MANCRRIAAGIMGIMMLVVMLASVFYIAAEAGHDCTGDECPICVCIQQCENHLHQLGSSLKQAAAAFIPVFIIITAGFFVLRDVLRKSPVSIKVRLNN